VISFFFNFKSKSAHFKWNSTVSELTLPGYILYTNDLNSTSRGIAMFVDRELKSKQLYSSINALENVIIEIELNNTRLFVTTIYRSPNSADDNKTCINNLITDLCSHIRSVISSLVTSIIISLGPLIMWKLLIHRVKNPSRLFVKA